MNRFIYILLSTMIGMAIGMFIYAKSYKKYNITNKIKLKLPIENKWVPRFIVIIMFILFIILVIIKEIVNMPDVVYYTSCGVIIGVMSGFNNSNTLN